MNLYYHSILSSSKVHDGKPMKNICEKVILNIFFRIQSEMKQEIESIVSREYPLEDGENLKKFLLKGKSFQTSYELEELRKMLKERIVKKFSEPQSLNLTQLVKELGLNITKTAKEVEDLPRKVFHFNYINHKKSDITLESEVMENMHLTRDERGICMHYTIPMKILRLLLFPEQYSTIDMEVVKKLDLKYSIKLYILIMDHRKKGSLTLSKKEIGECFSLPKSYLKDRYLLEKEFLIPVLAEIGKSSGLKISYEFRPDYRFEEIFFRFEKTRIFFPEEILDKIKYAKKNIYFSRAWDQKGEEFLLDFFEKEGEEMTRKLLQRAYEDLKAPIRTTLPNFLFSVSQKILDEERKKIFSVRCKKKNLLSENLEAVESFKNSAATENFKNLEKNILLEKENSSETLWEIYENFSESEKKNYEILARNLFCEKLGSKSFDERYFQAAFRWLVTELISTEEVF